MKSADLNCEVVIIGAGIAGASLAYELARRGTKVCLAEMESHPGYHTTGRSAATFVGCYGNETIRAISAASRPFFESPPRNFSELPLLTKRGALYIAGKKQLKELDDFINEPSNSGLLEHFDSTDILEKVPILNFDAVGGGAFEIDAKDIDVNALLIGYLKGFREAGGMLLTGAEALSFVRQAGLWKVETPAGNISAPIVVNAAGAWGDEIAKRCGTRTVGLVPKRRTALTIDLDEIFTDWPLTISLDETWYFRPEAGHLLISPADETPSSPCDCQPNELDIAECVDRIERVTQVKVSRIISRRAGLRTFVHDKSPVCGFADDVDDFFWLVGQGGYGIQTSPALAEIAASLVLSQRIGDDIVKLGVTDSALSPARLACSSS